MHIIRRGGWEVIERQPTPGHVVMNRRSLLAGATSIIHPPMMAMLFAVGSADNPAETNFKPSRPITEEK